jgi:hypothetical protein
MLNEATTIRVIPDTFFTKHRHALCLRSGQRHGEGEQTSRLDDIEVALFQPGQRVGLARIQWDARAWILNDVRRV